jgi:DNA-binding transcriptional ArsR family regulator
MLISFSYAKSVLAIDVIEQARSTASHPVIFLDFLQHFLQPDIDSSTADTILFDSVEAAQEVAYTLRAQWDSFNGVEISSIDWVALETATNLVKGQWCRVGDSEFTTRSRRSLDPQVDSPELPQGFLNISFIDIRTEISNLLALPNCREISFPISRAEVYWCIADWNGAHNAEDVASGTGFSKSTVQGHLSALEKAGALRSEGRPKRYTSAEDCSQEYLSQLSSLASLARQMRGTRNHRHC